MAALWTGFAVASLLGLLALLQVVGVQSVVSWLPAMVAGRPGATVGNPIYLGAYMALMLLVGLELTRCVLGTSSSVVACTVGLVLVTVGLVANLSRGPWLGAAAGVVVWAGLGLRRREVRGAVVVPLVVVVVAAGLFAWQLPHLGDAGLSVGARAEGGTAAVSSTGEPNTIATRVELWKVAAAAMRDRPLLGWGPGNFVTAGRQHMTAKLVGRRTGALRRRPQPLRRLRRDLGPSRVAAPAGLAGRGGRAAVARRVATGAVNRRCRRDTLAW